MPAHPIQPLRKDASGVLRFQQNKIVSDLLDHASKHGMDLNDIARRDYSNEDRQQLAQLIGDCRETRKQLRQVVHYWAMDACEQRAWRRIAETNLLTARTVVTMLLIAMKGDRSKRARSLRRLAAIALKD